VAFPADRELHLLPANPARLEPPLELAAPSASARPRLHYTPEAHYLRALTPADRVPEGAEVRRYALESWARLLGAGPRRPPFDARGLLRGSERGERLFLWPSGMRSPGAMRTPGRQATAFLGRRRFERAELFDGRLRMRPKIVP
jgi:hypothetical protein